MAGADAATSSLEGRPVDNLVAPQALADNQRCVTLSLDSPPGEQHNSYTFFCGP